MPIHIDPQLIDSLVKRQIEHDTAQRTMTPAPSQPPGDLSPKLLALLGAAADGASTYSFMRDGSGNEDNALYRPLGKSPLATGLAVAGTGIASTALIHKILGKRFPVIAGALIANQGANQIGLAGRNLAGDHSIEGATVSTPDSYNRSVTQAIRRMHSQ